MRLHDHRRIYIVSGRHAKGIIAIDLNRRKSNFNAILSGLFNIIIPATIISYSFPVRWIPLELTKDTVTAKKNAMTFGAGGAGRDGGMTKDRARDAERGTLHEV